jgi:hypothetical protein
MMAFGEKLPQALGRLRDRIRGGDADDVKAFPPRVGDEGVLQKSRLA